MEMLVDGAIPPFHAPNSSRPLDLGMQSLSLFLLASIARVVLKMKTTEEFMIEVQTKFADEMNAKSVKVPPGVNIVIERDELNKILQTFCDIVRTAYADVEAEVEERFMYGDSDDW